MSSRQPVSDETLTSSKGEDRDISNVASETDDSVYDCKISCASLMGQFEPEDKSRKIKDSLADLCYYVNPDGSRKTCKYKHSSNRESVGSISTPPLSRLDLHSCVAFDGILNVMD
ncbi:hypothetical protein T4B_8591 [Trichinella pseudospiralis]|uniref:Uncharacterized protein n=1 Tax=Trichinella pseudospiralis TaxID=6337 RepID=A0A0V1ID36_TRIPS|nr:hypothetical protein T4B_6166 [Trichinella pseudospiralis]KRZ20721.1 hypothetical protein T4B_8591 [Trichinella pseudospiralis]KRZ24323.1 hypothetical protein T4C_4946 [Trichinella pseudospiralis]KRZ45544.1 hypothetical protein T4C_9247 [Trichinella pseudospiralis]